MVFRIGTINHAKGYIVNKLWEQRRIGASHLPVELLPRGYPDQHRGLIPKALEKLRAEGVVRVRPQRSGRDSTNHVSLVASRLSEVRGLMNAYRKSVKRPRVARNMESLL